MFPLARLRSRWCVASRQRRLFLEALEDRRVLDNQPPEITVPMPYGAPEDQLTSVPGIVISDPDAGSGNLQVKVQVAAGQFTATAAGALSLSGSGTGSLTLLGNLTDINATLASLAYLSAPDDHGPKAFSVEANDFGNTGAGGPKQTTVSPAFLVFAVNDPPSVSVPGPFSTPQGTPLDFGGIVMSDIDSGPATVELKLAATGGKLSILGDTSGLDAISDGNTFPIDGVDDPVVVLHGSLTAINAAVASNVRFIPSPGFAGAASILVEANDLGHLGSGGAKQDTKTIAITVVGPTPDPNPVLNSGAGNDAILLQRVGNNLVVTSGPTTLLNAELSLLTSVTVNGEAGNDQLTIDFSGGNPLPVGGLAYNGGSQTGAPGDSLVLTGGSTTSITHSFANASDGGITLAGPLAGTIAYTGLEPVVDNMAAADRLFTFTGGAETITLLDAAGPNMTIDSTLGESVTFANPTSSLSIDAGTGSDTVTIGSVDTDGPFNAGLTINGGADTDSITVNAPLTLGSVTSSGALSLAAETIDINQSISTTGVTTGTVSLTGAIVNLGANLSTDGATVAISGSTALVIDAATVNIDTESGNNGSAGAVTFAGTALIRADAASRNLVINADTSNAGSTNGSVTLAAFGNTGGTFVNDVTINADADAVVATGATVTIPAVSQIAGTLSITAGPIASNATFTTGPAAAVSLTSDAGITDGNGASANFVAQSLTASSATGIDLDTTITTLTSASVNAGGDINISDTAGGLAVTSATTSGTGGNITLQATGGSLTLTTVSAGGTGDVVASTGTNGDILVGNVTATSDTITLISATGAIEESGADAGSDLSAAIIDLTAATGIGAAAQIEIDANTAVGEGLTAAVSLAGNINLRDADALRVNSVTSGGGSITLGASGNLTLGSVTTAGSSVILDAGGAITDGDAGATTNITADEALVIGLTGIGASADPIETDVDTLDFDNTSNGLFVANSGGLALSDLGSTVPARAAGGAITANSPLVIGMDTTITGAMTFTAGNSGANDDDLTITSGVTVSIDASVAVNFSAGDDIVFGSGATISDGAFSGTVNLNAHQEGAGGDSDGGGVTQSGAGTSVAADNLNIVGPDGIGVAGTPLRIDAVNITTDSSALNGGQFLHEANTVTIAAAGLSAGAGGISLVSGTWSLGGSDRINNSADLTVNSPAIFSLASFSDTIDALAGNGTVRNGTAASTSTLTVGNNGGSADFSGVLQNGAGTLALTKIGAGTQTLSGTNTYTGATNIHVGRLDVTGSISSNVSVTAPGILGGTGIIDGDVSGTGTVAPGASPGILAIDAGNFGPVGTLAVELNGTTPGNAAGNHDQVDVVGGVDVTGTNLNLALGFTPAASSTFVIVRNNAGDAIGGTFAGLDEGEVFLSSGTQFQITYQGGPGNNDIILTAIDPASPTISGTPGDDLFVVRKIGVNVQVLLNGNQILLVPITSITGVMTFNGLAGSDTTHVDYSADGFFDIDITVDGGTGVSDMLAVEGDGTTTSVYTPSATITGDGRVTVNTSALINFSDLEPLDLFGMATATLALPLTGANDTLTIVNGFNLTAAAGPIGTIPALVVAGTTGDTAAGAGDGTAIETVAFSSNTTVIVDTTNSDGSDAVTITSANNSHGNTNLNVTTGVGGDVVQINGGVTFALGAVTIASQQINFNAGGVVTAASAVLNAGSGAITDSDMLNDVTASSLRATAAAGISLDTAVSTVAAANGPTGGNIDIANNVGGLLTIGTVGPTVGVTNTAPGGNVVIVNASPLTVAANVSAVGSVTLTASESAAAGDDLTVNAGVSISSSTSFVELQAGDDFLLPTGSTISGPTAFVSIFLTSLDTAADAAGSVFNFAGDFDGSTAALSGAGQNDTFNIRPDGDGPGGDFDTPISLDGQAPVVAPGDVLNLDLTGKTDPNLTVTGVGAGSWAFTNAALVQYASIEQVNVSPAGTCYGLTVDMNPALGAINGLMADTITVQVNGPNLEVLVNAVVVFSGGMAQIDHLTVLGSGDVDRFEINESGGLPAFCEPADGPAASHSSPTFTSLTGYGGAGAAIDIHLDGSGGVDQLQLNLAVSHAVVYTSDNLDSDKSGNVGIGTGGPFPAFGARQLGISFESLAPITIVGAGGTFTADASSSPAGDVTSLTIDDALGAGTTSITPNAGSATFEPVTFSGFAGLVVRGGMGAQIIDLVSIDAGSGLTSIVLDADNLPSTDIADDTVRVQSTNSLPATVRMLAGQGNDSFRLERTNAPQTIDGIAGQVLVSPNAGPFIDEAVGNDALIVSDIGDASGDAVSINQFSIEGLTSFIGSPDIDYRNIDILNLTATSGADTLDAAFAAVSDLETVTISGWIGGDQFYLSTTDEQILGAVATGIQTINLFGDAPGNPNNPDGNDIFGQSLAALLPGTPVGLGVALIRPSISTLINIDGGRPTAVLPVVGDQSGDELNLDVSALAPPVLVATLGGAPSLPGVAQSIAAPPSHRPVNFVEIEDINLVDEGILTDVHMGDLYIRGSDNTDAVSFLAMSADVARVRVNAFQGYFTITGDAVVYGRGGNDYLQLGNFNHPAEFYGEEGDDYLAGYLAPDKLVGGLGRDRINAGGGNNTVWGDRDPVEAGLEDTLFNRQLIASEGSGQRLESLDADILSALDGHDRVYGGPGGDSLTLGGGNDYAYGGQGNDSIALGAGDDRGYGGAGHDTITGAAGNDLISGGDGNDIQSGGEGLDVLIGGGGNDGINGDNGDDLLFDGLISLGGNSADSQAFGDPSDQAMADLLAEWAATNPAAGPLVTAAAATNDNDGDADSLRGSGGLDLFSADLDDIFDLEPGEGLL